jgi:hypothetical protein
VTLLILVLQAVILDFNNFETETLADYVYVYDGWNESASLIASLSGYLSTPPRGYITSQRYMLVRFTTNYDDVYHGFKATFTTLDTIGKRVH